MEQAVDEIVNPLIHMLNSQHWLKATKAEIEDADGRSNRSNPICIDASCLYVAYSGNEVLYIGETSKSIKRRFISDGSGSHREACSNWYARMTHVQYIPLDESKLPVMYRKLLEQALSIFYKPLFYGSRKIA